MNDMEDQEHKEEGSDRTTEILIWIRNAVISSVILFASFKYIAYATLRYGYTSYGTAAAITQVCLVWAIVFAALVLLSKRLPRILQIARYDLLYVFIFLLLSGPMLMAGIYFFRNITTIYQRRDDPRAQKILEQKLPRLVPDRDEAIQDFHRGSADGSIQWKPWITSESGMSTFLVWGVYVFFFLCICFSLVFLFSRRWLEDEQLAFPLAGMSRLFIEGQRQPDALGGGRVPLLRSHAFWIGFSLTLIFQMSTYLSPGLEARLGAFSIQDTVPLLGKLDYQSRQFWYRPVYLAMFFMCPRHILGSAIISHAALIIFTIIGVQFGYHGYTGSELWGAPPFPFKQDQLLGASIALAILMFWSSRKYLKEQLLEIGRMFSLTGKAENVKKTKPIAMFIFILSTAGFITWSLVVGFSLSTTIMFTFCILLATIVNTRGRAETGVPMITVFSDYNPIMLIPALGTKLVGLKAIAATALHGWLLWNNAILHVTPSIMDSMKLGQMMRRSYRWILGIAVFAVFAGIMLGFYITLESAYDLGANHWGFGYGHSWFITGAAVSLMNKETGFNWTHGSYVMGGVGVVIGLWMLRAMFPGFWIHPLGYMLSLHGGLHHFSLSLILAYLFKSLSIHYGGVRSYVKLVPFFVGLLCGQIGGGALVGLLNILRDTNVYVPMF